MTMTMTIQYPPENDLDNAILHCLSGDEGAKARGRLLATGVIAMLDRWAQEEMARGRPCPEVVMTLVTVLAAFAAFMLGAPLRLDTPRTIQKDMERAFTGMFNETFERAFRKAVCKDYGA